MIAIAVGRLDKHHVCPRRGDRIRQDRPAVSAQVATEQDRLATRQSHQHVCGAEEMPGGHELDRDAWRNLHRPLVSERLQMGERAQRVRLVVERHGRLVLRVPVLVGLPRILSLDTARIRQHETAQV